MQVDWLEALLARRERVALALTYGAALLVAVLSRFVQDDAFISFVYARSLVEGDGLTWFGARVEGYTNFSWVLWIAAGLALGVSATLWSWLGGLVCWVVCLHATYTLGSIVLGRRAPALLAVALLAANHSVASYATGGLETMPQAALSTVALVLALRLRSGGSVGTALSLSFVAAAALLLRLDSAVLLAVAGAIALHGLARARRWRCVVALLLPGAVIVGAWLAWKISYYGALLPNTYHAKLGDGAWLRSEGLVYLGRFLHWYALWPVALLSVAALVVLRRGRVEVVPLLVAACVWLLYVVHTGGDFMEFRFLVPVAPVLFVLLAHAIHDGLAAAWTRGGLAVVVVAWGVLAGASWRHAQTFRGTTADLTLDSIPTLGSCYDLYPDGDWHVLGRALHDAVGDLDLLVALQPVGAIPYFSRVRTLDMWGLNDPEVARAGNPVDPAFRRPGHRRHVSLEQLRARGVHLVIGHPVVLVRGALTDPRTENACRSWARQTLRFEPRAFGRVTVVEVPVGDDRSMLAWALTAHDGLAARIARRGWPTRTVEVAAAK